MFPLIEIVPYLIMLWLTIASNSMVWTHKSRPSIEEENYGVKYATQCEGKFVFF